MKHLQFPFAENVSIEVSNGKKKILVNCELASSVIEIFQSLSYRKKKDFKKPLALVFSSPTIQHFSMQSFDFPVVQINVDYQTNLVKKILDVPKSRKTTGSYIQSHSEFSLVLLIPNDSELLNEIILDRTKIKIRTGKN